MSVVSCSGCSFELLRSSVSVWLVGSSACGQLPSRLCPAVDLLELSWGFSLTIGVQLLNLQVANICARKLTC